MPFPSTDVNQILPVDEGELGEGAKIVLSTTVFEDGLNIGRFAKIDTGSLDNLDGSSNPVIAGVVLRSPVDLIELPGQAGNIDSIFKSEPNQNYIRQGLVTVKLAAGSTTPSQFGAVYAVNEAGNTDNGNVKAASGTETVATTAEFVSEAKPGIWWIRIK